MMVLAGMLGAGVAACGGEEGAPPAGTAPAGAPAAVADGVELTFTSTPAPPRMGGNTFDVTVVDANGQPVTDAEVSVELFMAAMPEVKMPEMRSSATLTHQGEGRYQGPGQVVMAGDWEVTVTASRGGDEIGRRQLTVTAAQ